MANSENSNATGDFGYDLFMETLTSESDRTIIATPASDNSPSVSNGLTDEEDGKSVNQK